MKNLTIGKKIALGFGALIFIAATLGIMAVFSMKSVQTQARTLAEGFVPESQVAGNLEDAVAATQLAVRSYGLTADNGYLEATHKGMEDIHQQQQAARKLSDAHPELVKLREDLNILDPLVQTYEALIAQTETKNQDIAATREKLNSAAADFISKIDKLTAGQKERLDNEIKSFTEAPRLEERANKLMLANGIRGDGNAARIAVFKAQALRNPKLIEEGLKNFESMDQKFDQLQGMLKVPADIDELNAVVADAHAYRDAMKEIMDDNTALAEIAVRRVDAADRVTALVEDTRATGMKRTVDAANNSTQKLNAASVTMIAGLAAAMLIGFTVAFLIIRNSNRVLTSVANSLNDGSSQVVAASSQVSAASQTLAEGASEQASSLEETSSSLEEMSSMTKRNSENARKANELAKEARQAADRGVGDMQTMAAAMNAIKVSSDDIAKIIKTIDEIAFQTNILALNAAVEAARAGEAGMGFAVVADEVRNLAQRCAQAAKETSGKIEGAIARTGQGVDISDKVSQVLNEIVIKVRQVDELVTEVAGASGEQTDGINQINSAVGQMDKVTQGNASTAEESAAAAEELNAQAEVMKKSVAELLRLVGSENTAANRSSHAAPSRRFSSVPVAKARASAKLDNLGHRNGNRHDSAAPAVAATAKSRHEIPLEDDFKNF